MASFQIKAQNNYAVAIALLSNWLLKSHANFSANEKQNRTHLAPYVIFPRFEKVAGNDYNNSDCFIASFAPVAIARTNYFDIFVSFDSHLKNAFTIHWCPELCNFKSHNRRGSES